MSNHNLNTPERKYSYQDSENPESDNNSGNNSDDSDDSDDSEQDLENPESDNNSENNSDDSDEDDYGDIISNNSINNISTGISNPDDDIQKAIEASLINYKQNEEEQLNLAMMASLSSIEEDRKKKLKKQEDDDFIFAKTLTESYSSNIAVQINSGVLIGDENDEEAEYMRVILQQIKDSEECETRSSRVSSDTSGASSSKINQSRTIIEEQDFEYKETLRKDIEREEKKEKEKEKEKNNTKQINKDKDLIKTKNIEDDKPKTREEMRKARMEFFQKK